MDLNTIRIIVTIASLVVFVGIVIWVWRNRNTKDFKEAASLPFNEK